LVLAADLEKVEEIGAAGMDLDKVFGRIGRWCWEVDGDKVEWSGDIGGYLYSPHSCNVAMKMLGVK